MYDNTHTNFNTTATTISITSSISNNNNSNNDDNNNNIYIAPLKAEVTVLWQTSKSKKLRKTILQKKHSTVRQNKEA